LRRYRFGVESNSLREFRNGGVVLPFSHVRSAETEMGARIARILGGRFLVEGDCLIELPKGEIGAAEFLQISDVARIGVVGFLQSGDGFGIPAFSKI